MANFTGLVPPRPRLLLVVAAIWAAAIVSAPAGPSLARVSDPTLLTAMARAVNTARMFTDLETLSTGLKTRSSTTPQFDTACQYALDVFRSLGLSASLDPFTVRGHAMTNVVAVKPGSLYPSQVIIIGAHLDSTSPSATTLAPGAEDNGSGSVAVLEAARLLATLPSERTVHFILFAGEEQGLYGSAHYAAEARAQNMDIRAMLTMDMIRYNDPAGADLWIEGFHQGTSSVWLMNQLGNNARTYGGLTTYLYPGEGFGSDHEPFHQQGFPAVLAIENEYESYACYHRTCDTVDKLDAGLMRKIAGAVLVTTAELAGVTTPLGWISGNVVMSGGGSPAGAVVSLSGTAWSSATVGANGQFSFRNLLPADYTLSVTKTGSTPVSVSVTVPAGSVVIQTMTLDGPPAPGVPTGLAATVVGSAVTLSWTAPVTGGAPTSYVIEAGSGRGLHDLVNFSTGTAASTYTANGVAHGLYYVRVRATQAVGTSAPSNEVAVRVGPEPPDAPMGLTGSSAGLTVTLSWAAPTMGGTATGYVIEAGAEPGQTNLANFSTGTAATTFSAAGVADGKYYVRVRATNSAGTSGPSNETIVTVGCTSAPTPPTGLVFTQASGGTVVFGWTAPVGLPNNGPTTYVLEAGTAPGITDLVAGDLGGPATTYRVAGVGAGTYHVRIRAKNVCGASGVSNEVVLIVP